MRKGNQWDRKVGKCAVWLRKLLRAVDKAGLQTAVMVKELSALKKKPGTVYWDDRARAHSPKESCNLRKRKFIRKERD